jgi:hypothetical protein
MTVIRLDAATLAALKAATGTVYLADENGEPVLACLPYPVYPLDQEPKFTAEERQRLRGSAVKYTTEQAIAWLKRKG